MHLKGMIYVAVTLNAKYLEPFVNHEELEAIFPQVQAAHRTIHEKSGPGNDFLGWLDLPVDYDREEFTRIQKAAQKIRSNSQVLIVIGIGGSYLGARAAIELLHSQMYNDLATDTPKIYFVGNSISPSYLNQILKICEGKDFSINVISKSGTTTEPALAFRIFRKLAIEKYGREGAKERIFCTTDKARGTLKQLADELDIISIHSYPLWNGNTVEEALEVNKTWYKKVKEWYPGKPIVFSEVGWATDCADFKQMREGQANEENQKKYYEEFWKWSDREQIISYMFEAFDEPWKGGNRPNEAEKHWGIFNEDRTPKLVLKK